MTRTAKNPTGWHSEKKKIEVVTTYLALGKAPLVTSVTGVPVNTIRQWRMKPWWKELELEIRQEETLELDARLRKIVDKSLDAVVDRLENGELSRNRKTGKLMRTPVTMRDAERVATDLMDKRSLLQKQPQRQINQQTFDDRLLKLAEQFAEMALGKRKGNEEKLIIDGEYEHAVHDQRIEGLQERTLLGAQEETKSGEGSGKSEQSEESHVEESGKDGDQGKGYRPQTGNIQGWFNSDTQPDGAE